MTTSPFMRALMAVGFAAAVPLAAQTPPVPNQTMGINPAPTSPTTTTVRSQTTVTTTTQTRSMAHHRIKTTSPMPVASKPGIWTDATRLAALLADSQGKVAISTAAWKVVANEANTLANKLVARTGGNATARKAATEARLHVREMRTAAMAGDADSAKTHAGMALPFVVQLIDWSAGKPK